MLIQAQTSNPRSRERSRLTVPIKTWRDFQTKFSIINLLHLNCEGCEFDALEGLIDTDFVKRVQNIFVQVPNDTSWVILPQLGFHIHCSLHAYLDQFHGHDNPAKHEQRCHLHELLRRTHTLHLNVPFLWETWRLRAPDDEFHRHNHVRIRTVFPLSKCIMFLITSCAFMGRVAFFCT